MIEKKTMYIATCDICQMEWQDYSSCRNALENKASLEIGLDEYGWILKDNKLLCPECWECDDDGNIVIIY